MTEADKLADAMFTIQDLSAQVDDLQQQLAVASASNGDGTQFQELLAAAQAQSKSLAAQLDAMRSMRDSFQAENVELKRQCTRYAAALKKAA